MTLRHLAELKHASNAHTQYHTHNTYSHIYTHTLHPVGAGGVAAGCVKRDWQIETNVAIRLENFIKCPAPLADLSHPYIIKGHGYYDNTENTSNDRQTA